MSIKNPLKKPALSIREGVYLTGMHEQSLRHMERDGVFKEPVGRAKWCGVQARLYSFEQMWTLLRVQHIHRTFECGRPAAVFILRLMEECEELRAELEKCKQNQ